MESTTPDQTRIGSYDRVVLPGGRTVSRREFEALPLRERVGYLMEGSARFFRGLSQVTASEAMKG